jgi:Zn-dependent peptidase ImmA (M78 family)
MKPHEQGYALATWLRGQPGVTDLDGRVDAEKLLTAWGVPTKSVDLGPLSEELGAVAVWSSVHGPWIFVNLDGRRSSGVGGRNFTLAHEICHLLIDRFSSLPLVEIFGGRLPAAPEKRANAFAAELLLPREIARKALGPVEEELASSVRAYAKFYRVSDELIAWQIRNCPGVRLSPYEEAYLKSLVHDPTNF